MNIFEKSSVLYHDIFNYPLTGEELVKWRSKTGIKSITGITSKRDYYFLNGHEEIISKRLQNEKTSVRKMKIAKKAAKILSKIPSVKLVAVTGSLAMMNSTKESDIDLMIVTRKGTLWLSRLVILVILFLLDTPVRRSNDQGQCDKLCLNMWLDEADLVWEKSDRNLYTAHEIAQIVPLVNKDETYERFLWSNRWILDYWPNVAIIQNSNLKTQNYNSKLKIFEKFAFWIQYNYMRLKITREIISPTRALFHPHDWGKVVLKKLSS